MRYNTLKRIADCTMILVAVICILVVAVAAFADRTEVSVNNLSVNAATNSAVASAYTVIDATAVSNGLKVLYDEDEKIFIHIKNTHGAVEYATVEAGDYWANALGALAIQLSATTGEKIVGPLESARFKQDDGYIHISLDTGMTGYIGVFKMP